MAALVAGLALWSGAHWFRRLFPATRARLGDDKARTLVSLAVLAGLILMVIGVRGADTTYLYTPLPGAGWLTLALMVLSIWFFNAPYLPGRHIGLVRHNMLTGLLLWAAGHLLVNGDLVSVTLFGWMAAHALVSMALINRRVPRARPAPGPLRNDALNLAATALTLFVVVLAHRWLGYDPLLGTYG
ncbi:MAG: NnrU family protein [Paracoccaceae bacterium]